MNNTSPITVLIPTWKRLQKFKVALQSLEKQSLLPDRVVVISRDIDLETNQWLEKNLTLFNYPIEHYQVDQPGVIHAENEGLKHIKEGIVAFLDDDAEAPPNWISLIRDEFTDPSIVGVGGPDYIVHEKDRSYPKTCSQVGQLTYFGKVIGNHHQNILGRREVSILKGVNMAFRRKELPFLDKALSSEHHLGNGSQWELDLCLHVQNKGKLIFNPELKVNHYSNHSHFNRYLNQRNNAHNIVYVLMKHFSWDRKLAYLCYIILIGNQQNIGLLKFLSLIPRLGAKDSYHLFLNSCIGAFFGLKTYRKTYRKNLMRV